MMQITDLATEQKLLPLRLQIAIFSFFKSLYCPLTGNETLTGLADKFAK